MSTSRRPSAVTISRMGRVGSSSRALTPPRMQPPVPPPSPPGGDRLSDFPERQRRSSQPRGSGSVSTADLRCCTADPAWFQRNVKKQDWTARKCCCGLAVGFGSSWLSIMRNATCTFTRLVHAHAGRRTTGRRTTGTLPCARTHRVHRVRMRSNTLAYRLLAPSAYSTTLSAPRS